MPGMGRVWHWQSWAEEACCCLLDLLTVSSHIRLRALGPTLVLPQPHPPRWPPVSAHHPSAPCRALSRERWACVRASCSFQASCFSDRLFSLP